MLGAMDDTYLVVDIETVPVSGEEPEDGSFPALVTQRVVSVGVLWLDKGLRFKKLGTVSEGKEEKEILADFNRFMGKHRPQLVTFNGRRFDMPVIVLRSLVHGLSMKWYFASKEYRTRYDPNRHIDLCDRLSEHGAGRFPSLGDMAEAIGLPGKLGMDGSDVLGVWKEGDMERIHTYCLMDVVQTGFVLMRWFLVMGKLSLEDYREAATSLRDSVTEESRFEELVSSTRWDEVVLLGE
jgi:predicted PolB exonuclease-like 3'-5' exonuclease